MNSLEIIKRNFEGNNIDIIIENGEPLFELYSTGMALGQVIKAKGNLYPNKARIDQNIKNAEISTVLRDAKQYLSEPMLYDLMLEMQTDKVKPFRKWVTNDVLPTIRKTGGYVANEDMFIDIYLPYADNTVKDLFKSTLTVVRSQNELIQRQKVELETKSKEIEYKEDVIIGLVDNITLAEKRQILNRVVRRCNNYRERWYELYRQFEMKYHLNLEARLERYNSENKPKIKSKLDYIDKVMNKVPELYEIATKLYENDIKDLVEELYSLQASGM